MSTTFSERYGLNSRLVARDGRLVEEVYRIGGKYDLQIRAIVGHLENAVRLAPPPLAASLRALIEFYRTGEETDRIAYDVAWVSDQESRVDTINGFVEVYMDPRGVKGAWEATRLHRQRGEDPKDSDARGPCAVVRRSHAVRSAIPEEQRARHHRQGD